MLTCRIIVCVLFISAITNSAIAAQLEPATLSYQGTLTDNTGIALTGTKTLRVCLYKTADGSPGMPAEGGTAFWCDNYSVTLKNGQFSIILGSTTNKLTDQFSNFTGETYIGIKVGNDAEMPVRQRLTSVVYAVNAVNAKVSESVTSTDSIIPPGSVMTYAGSVLPPGWLWCDGTEYDNSAYPRLVNAIGTAHGSSNVATKFRVPDYRGRFLRGVDGTAGNDPDKLTRTAMNINGNTGLTGSMVGSVQDQATSKNGLAVNDPGHSHPNNYGASTLGSGTYGGYGLLLNTPVSQHSDLALNNTTGLTITNGDNETRPKNAYVNWIIKY